MGAVYSVCGSGIMTLAGDFLPKNKITEGINRFAFTVSIGMAVGPFVGIQVQNHLNSRASFVSIFGITVAALIFVLFSRIKYPKIRKRKFSIKETIYKPALPFMFNMMFLMIPYGAVIAYSSILAQEKNLLGVLPYFLCLPCNGNAGFKNIHTKNYRFWKTSFIGMCQFNNFNFYNDKLYKFGFFRPFIDCRFFIRSGIRNLAALVPGFCYGNYAPGKKRGCKFDLYAFL